jgi:hypothetical protein
MARAARCLGLAGLMGVLAAGAGAADTATGKSDAEHFADLALGFCGAVVSQPGKDIRALAATLPGIQVQDAKPLKSEGQWGAALQDRLRATPETLVHVAATQATRVGAFHLAFALTDGSRCIAVGQEMPGARDAVRERLEADPQFQVIEEGMVRLFGRAAEGERVSYAVMLPPVQSEITEVRLERFPVRPRVSREDRDAWVRTVLDTCAAAAATRRGVTVAQFGGYLHERPGKDGKPGIASPERYPAAMLFTEEGRPGCRVMLTGGSVVNEEVTASLRALLQERGAGRSAGHYLLQVPVEGASRPADVRVEIASLLNGTVQSVSIYGR